MPGCGEGLPWSHQGIRSRVGGASLFLSSQGGWGGVCQVPPGPRPNKSEQQHMVGSAFVCPEERSGKLPRSHPGLSLPSLRGLRAECPSTPAWSSSQVDLPGLELPSVSPEDRPSCCPEAEMQSRCWWHSVGEDLRVQDPQQEPRSPAAQGQMALTRPGPRTLPGSVKPWQCRPHVQVESPRCWGNSKGPLAPHPRAKPGTAAMARECGCPKFSLLRSEVQFM